jgi:hypothetical protein
MNLDVAVKELGDAVGEIGPAIRPAPRPHRLVPRRVDTRVVAHLKLDVLNCLGRWDVGKIGLNDGSKLDPPTASLRRVLGDAYRARGAQTPRIDDRQEAVASSHLEVGGVFHDRNCAAESGPQPGRFTARPLHLMLSTEID